MDEVFKAISYSLNEDGTLVFEDPYIGSVIKMNSYDQFYDEHVHVFSLIAIQKIIEKPSLQNAPSNRFAVGRYVFENKIFGYLAKTEPDKSGEIQLTEAIDNFLKKGNQVFGFPLNGKVFDCGEKIGYLSANLEFAKKDPLLKRFLKSYMKNF